MGLFSKLFGQRSPIEAKPSEHAVVVNFDYGSTDLQPIFDLSTQLENAIVAAHAGEFDGNEIAADGSDGFLFMYGPDADRLFQVVRPVLEACSFMRRARVKLRYGPPEDGVREKHVVIGA
jgi:hypothetical protein